MNILDFGAVRGTFSGDAIQNAIDAAAAQGGGRVVVPAGEYLTASLVMKSNVELHLQAGAVLRFVDDFDAYPIIRTRWEGYEQDSHRPLLYAKDEQNVAVTGMGTLEGQGKKWWTAFRAGEMTAARPCFICFEDCERVLLEGFKVQNSPAWTVHPLRCRNVTIQGLTVVNPSDSPNTDGIDPESCCNVRISGCHIDVGDDCIAIKAGTEDADFAVPCENVTVTGCTMVHGHGGVVLGSEMSGSIRRVAIAGCVFDGTDRGIRIKTRRGRGGSVEDVSVTGIVMNDVLCPLVINLMYFCGKDGKAPIVSDPNPQPVTQATPHVRRIRMADIVVTNVKSAAACLYGLPEAPLEDISIVNTQIHLVKSTPVEPVMNAVAKPVTLCGLQAEHIRGLHMTDVRIVGAEGEEMTLKDVE
ncbi:MAG: glycoside hydrolase family 28 protein [Clostridia bacterium]|nr:glycoside hydrolase family 28 protein [Clostridia bacterium]